MSPETEKLIAAWVISACVITGAIIFVGVSPAVASVSAGIGGATGYGVAELKSRQRKN